MDNVTLKTVNKYKNIVIFLVVLIMLIGILFLGSVSQPISLKTYRDTLTIYKKQFYIIIAGMIFCTITYNTYYNFKKDFEKKYGILTMFMIGFIFIFLITPFVPGLGVTVKGATRWIRVGVNLQPSELVKPIVIICTASILNFAEDRKELMSMLAILFVAFALPIYLQKSNTSMLQIAVIVSLMFCHTNKFKELEKLSLGMAGLSIVGLFFWLKKTFGSSYVSSRLKDYIAGTSGQANASVTAIKVGGLTGVGIGEGTQKYFFLPEAHNDYIFAAISEEAGFIIALLIIIIFCILILLMFLITEYMKMGLNSYICYGIVYNITNQFIGNILINLNIAPSTGITLPFISSGGSSLLSNMMCVALFLACVNLEFGKENK